MDKDARFSREFEEVIERFGENKIAHGAEFFEDINYNGTGKIVFKENKIDSGKILEHIDERENMKISGGGTIKGEDVTVARVI